GFVAIDVAAKLTDELVHRVDVRKARHALERGFALGHEGGRDDRQRGILAAGDLDFAFETISAPYDEGIHCARPWVFQTRKVCRRHQNRLTRRQGRPPVRSIGQSIGRRLIYAATTEMPVYRPETHTVSHPANRGHCAARFWYFKLRARQKCCSFVSVVIEPPTS